jgi:hypothetical protein
MKDKEKSFISPSKLHIPSLTNTGRVRLKKSTEAWQTLAKTIERGQRTMAPRLELRNQGDIGTQMKCMRSW